MDNAIPSGSLLLQLYNDIPHNPILIIKTPFHKPPRSPAICV